MAAMVDECSFYSIEIPMNATDIQKFTGDPHGFMNKVVKKPGRAEVSMKKLDGKQREKMKAAQWAECGNWFENNVAEPALRQEAQGPLMKCRWVLTIKDGGDCKARIVVLGFQDKDLGLMKTQAPTCSRRARNIFNQKVANSGYYLRKGDVKAAFLQGNDTQKHRNVCIEPVPELAEKFGLKEGEVLRLLKAVYGLCNAPLEWYLCINQWFLDHGWRSVDLEPCMWILHDEAGKLRGIAIIHVDDLLIAGDEQITKGNPFPDSVKQLKEDFRWGAWESGSFIQCGLRYTQLDDGTICMTFSEASRKIEPISEKFAKKGAVAGREHELLKTECRRALGSLQFVATQGMFWLSAGVSILQSEVPTADAELVKKINKQIRKCHETAHIPLKYYPQDETIFVAWSDGALAQRKNGGAQCGYMVCTSTPELIKGERRPLSMISHSSSKAPRVARSSLAVEVQAMTAAQEELNYCRAVWADLNSPEGIKLKEYNENVSSVTGIQVTDCRGLYDSVARSMSSAGGLADKRSAIEAKGIQQEASQTGTIIRWCHSEAMPADSLTKISEASIAVGLDFITRGYWRLVHDPDFVSAKIRKKVKAGDILDDVERPPIVPKYDDEDVEEDWTKEGYEMAQTMRPYHLSRQPWSPEPRR